VSGINGAVPIFEQVRALVRSREKAAEWADQGVELVDGDWNDATAIAAALKGVEGAFVMLPAVWAPSPDYKEGIPRAGWPEAFEQFGVPKGQTGPAEEMFESVNAGWMDLGITGTEHVAGATSARDVFASAQKSVKA